MVTELAWPFVALVVTGCITWLAFLSVRGTWRTGETRRINSRLDAQYERVKNLEASLLESQMRITAAGERSAEIEDRLGRIELSRELVS